MMCFAFFKPHVKLAYLKTMLWSTGQKGVRTGFEYVNGYLDKKLIIAVRGHDPSLMQRCEVFENLCLGLTKGLWLNLAKQICFDDVNGHTNTKAQVRT